MKWIKFFLFLLIPCFAFTQSTPSNKNGIGINLSALNGDGLSLNLRYTRWINKLGTAKLEFTTNFNHAYRARLGLEFLQLRKNKFELGIGLDLRYSVDNYVVDAFPTSKEFAVELPIELRYQINPNYSIFTGLSLSQNVWSNDVTKKKDFNIDYRLGLNFRF